MIWFDLISLFIYMCLPVFTPQMSKWQLYPPQFMRQVGCGNIG